ncbi:hypothetical protein PV761_04040 [Arthrobacter sp. CC3]|uniref:hypothetical protein n=1 Tax=Arthrobacter sp. CC3 TaxID=3029185 RepID=UPI003265BD3B
MVKFFGFFLTGSSSMLAEAAHSLAGSGTQALLQMAGGGLGEGRPVRPGRSIAAFIVSTVLFSLCGLAALFLAWAKFQAPHGFKGRWWWAPLAFILGAMVLESLSFITTLGISRRLRGGPARTGSSPGTGQPELGGSCSGKPGPCWAWSSRCPGFA